MLLPSFTYHPDPLVTGSIKTSTNVCRACDQARGFIYTGPTYSEEDLDNVLCPWCIADGTAHRRFDVEFCDLDGIGGYGEWDQIPEAVEEEVAYRTPGFSAWQQGQWWTHCGDAAQLLVIAGREELAQFGEQAMAAIAAETGYDGEELAEYMQALDKDRGPAAYVFRCRHCGRYGGYSDVD